MYFSSWIVFAMKIKLCLCFFFEVCWDFLHINLKYIQWWLAFHFYFCAFWLKSWHFRAKIRGLAPIIFRVSSNARLIILCTLLNTYCRCSTWKRVIFLFTLAITSLHIVEKFGSKALICFWFNHYSNLTTLTICTSWNTSRLRLISCLLWISFSSISKIPIDSFWCFIEFLENRIFVVYIKLVYFHVLDTTFDWNVWKQFFL